MKIIIFFCLAINLYAHGLNIFASDENGTLHIESFFSKSSPCIECDVSIIQNNKTQNLKTNQDGKLDYNIVSKDTIKISVNAGAGHYKEIEYVPNTIIKQETTTDSIIKLLISLFLIASIFYVLKKIKK